MTDLLITYTDESSEIRSVRIDKEKFVIGRHSECDLAVPDSRLSRRHLQIGRYADVFVVTDLGSSNGSKLNGEPLSEPKTIADGDILDLGGVEFSVESESDEPAADSAGSAEGGEASEASSSVSASSPQTVSSAGGGSIFGNFFIMAPLMGLAMLIVLGLGILVYTLVAGRDDAERGSRFPTPYEDTYDPTPEPSQSPGVSPAATANSVPVGDPVTQVPVDTPSVPSGNLDEEEKLRNLVTSFMRSIALRDPNPVVTSEPLDLIKNKIGQYRGSAALGANIEDAVRSAPQLEALARSKNMKPQFVIVAALAKLGGTRGSVLATANGMIGTLSELRIQIGDAFANECVVIIAAFDQGEAGQTLAMRDTMTKVATENPETSSRKARTIWFLKEKGKLSNTQFEFALRFLAFGTIAQDPKSFGVNARPLGLN